MKKKELKKILREKPGYLKSGSSLLSVKFGVKEDKVKEAIKEIRLERKATEIIEKEFEAVDLDIDETLLQDKSEYAQFLEWKKRKNNQVTIEKRPYLKPYDGNKDNVLIIGDLHEPFCLIKYLQFCREQQEKYDCGTIVFIGDLIDHHYSSYHETDLNAMGANEEFDLAKSKIQEWYKVFPEAWITIGNHDKMVHRKCKTLGISSKWIKDYDDALETPNWKFVDEVTLNNVNYNHGEGGTARTKMKTELMSQVQGHLHSQAYIEYGVGTRHKVFGIQVGCGIDRKSYAFAYGKNGPKQIISCAVVLDKGTLPILLPMEL